MLTLEEVASRNWDVVVVGAGPAGSVAARQIALLGSSVLLVDKAPLGRWKVCGCCLNGSALSLLDGISLGELVDRCGAVPLHQIRLAARGCQAKISLPRSVSLSRWAFDSALIEAGQAVGVQFMADTHATLADVDGERREVVLNHGGKKISVRTKLVLAADGLGSQLLVKQKDFASITDQDSRVGAGVVLSTPPPHVESGTIYMACTADGYVGMVVLEDGRLNLAAAFDRVALQRGGGPGLVAARIFREVGWSSIEGVDNGPWRGTAALTRQASTLSCERVLVLGDAAGYVEPFTGEGITWALGSAIAIAPLAQRAIEWWDATIGREWAETVRDGVRNRQGLCRAVAFGLRHPSITRSAIVLLSYAPKLATPFVRRMNAPSKRISRAMI